MTRPFAKTKPNPIATEIANVVSLETAPLAHETNKKKLAAVYNVSERTIGRRMAAGWTPGTPLPPPACRPTPLVPTPAPRIQKTVRHQIVPTGAVGAVHSAARADYHFKVPRWLLTILILAPIGGLNMGPRVAEMLNGSTNWLGWFFISFQVLVLVVLAGIPYKAEAAKTRLGRAVLWLLAIILIATNMMFSVEAVGHIRDAGRDRNRETASDIDSLSSRIEELRNERAGLPSFTPTSAEQIAAAQRAVEESITARDQECGKVGDNCRKRIGELNERQDKLSGLQSNKAIGDHANALDAKINDLEAQKQRLGAKPRDVDPGATRLSVLTLGLLTPEQVGNVLPTWWSFIAELLAFAAPIILLGTHAVRGC